MKLLIKILKILFGSVIVGFSLCSAFFLAGFVPDPFSKDMFRICVLILGYFGMHGISIIVWAVENNDPIHEFRIEIPKSNES
jgi:uncharacterized membrane protein YfcA